MKATTIAAILAPAALANAQWWSGAPECAQQCFSSAWESSSGWPAPTSYCGASQAPAAATCISSACAATPTAITSYSSLSSSLCARWESCSAAGSTGVLTLSAPAFTGTGFGPGGRFGAGGPGGGGRGPWGAEYTGTKTWTGGVYTVTGCEWNGSPWAGGPGGWGAGGLGGSPWGNWGAGWKWSTYTATVTQVITVTAGGSTAFSTSVGLATVAQAVSGEITQTSIITDGSATPTGNAAPGGAGDVAGVKVMGALLGGVVAVAGLL